MKLLDIRFLIQILPYIGNSCSQWAYSNHISNLLSRHYLSVCQSGNKKYPKDIQFNNGAVSCFWKSNSSQNIYKINNNQKNPTYILLQAAMASYSSSQTEPKIDKAPKQPNQTLLFNPSQKPSLTQQLAHSPIRKIREIVER